MTPLPTGLDRPHHDGSPLYVSTPQPALGETVSVRLRVPRASGFTSVHVRTAPDGEQFFTAAQVDRQSETETWWRADIVVRNPVTHYRFVLQGGPHEYAWLTGAGLVGRDVPDASDFRLTTYGGAPDWVSSAVVYQVFLDRFARSAARSAAHGPIHDEAPDWSVPAHWSEPVTTDHRIIGKQLYGGDLDGIVEHLDHIAGLGTTVLYLTPFFPARSNHRYDASSFDVVDDLLGGDEALARLCEAAAARGMRVIGDLTSNHTGAGHEWFVEAMASPQAHTRQWYFIDDDGDYVAWLDVASLPKLNWASEGLAARLLDADDSIVRRWLRAGLSGWRVDVANMTGRHGAQDANHEVARRMRRAAGMELADPLIVAEHVHDYTVDLPGDGWHGVMNYSGFTKPVWTWLRNHDREAGFLGAPVVVPQLPAQTMVETMLDFTSRIGWEQLRGSWNLLGSHDTTRIRTLIGTDPRLVDVAAGMLFTFPSVPMLTYGDEIGMEGAFGEDGRRPMPWDAAEWDERLLELYTSLIAVRTGSLALREGGLRFVYADGDALVYLREHPHESALVHVARAAHPPLTLPTAALSGVEEARTAYGPAAPAVSGEIHLLADGPQVRILIWPTPTEPSARQV